MQRYLTTTAVIVFFSCVILVRMTSTHAAAPPSTAKIIKDIPYSDTAKGDRRRSFDLYLPADSGKKPPLLAFIHGGFWLLPDDDYRIGPALAENFVQDGVAVALIRYRLAPAHRHPTQAEDVAAALAQLVKDSSKYGFDGRRIYLAGHSAGGHLASLVGLDSRYLSRHGLAKNSIAGIVSISGLYDLNPTWRVSKNQSFAVENTFSKDAALLRKASPIHHVRADAPPFLIISAFQDFPGFALDARRFADALRQAGAKDVQQQMIKGADHFTVVKFDDENNALRRVMVNVMGASSLPKELSDLLQAKRRWAEPPYSTAPFWQYGKLVRSYSIDERFVNMLRFIYRDRGEELLEWPLKQYHAIGLYDYLNALPKEQVGAGDFIALTNIRGERQVWHHEQIEKFKPVIVIGVDDEKNLFRFSTFYQMHHEYSWKPGGSPQPLTMALGAFVHFLQAPPRELIAQSWHFGLTADSFRRFAADPLAAVRSGSKDVEDALTFRNGCVYCHSLRGVGSRSHHVHALTGKAQGGFALALESYPLEVWKRFMFDQEAVAKKMGATPNIVQESARQALFELVNQARREQNQTPAK